MVKPATRAAAVMPVDSGHESTSWGGVFGPFDDGPRPAYLFGRSPQPNHHDRFALLAGMRGVGLKALFALVVLAGVPR